jgi:hypothetical protein
MCYCPEDADMVASEDAANTAERLGAGEMTELEAYCMIDKAQGKEKGKGDENGRRTRGRTGGT